LEWKNSPVFRFERLQASLACFQKHSSNDFAEMRCFGLFAIRAEHFAIASPAREPPHTDRDFALPKHLR
jgi:hypothetical protein